MPVNKTNESCCGMWTTCAQFLTRQYHLPWEVMLVHTSTGTLVWRIWKLWSHRWFDLSCRFKESTSHVLWRGNGCFVVFAGEEVIWHNYSLVFYIPLPWYIFIRFIRFYLISLTLLSSTYFFQSLMVLCSSISRVCILWVLSLLHFFW